MTVIIQTWRSLNSTASNIMHALYCIIIPVGVVITRPHKIIPNWSI